MSTTLNRTQVGTVTALGLDGLLHYGRAPVAALTLAAACVSARDS